MITWLEVMVLAEFITPLEFLRLILIRIFLNLGFSMEYGTGTKNTIL